VEYKDYEMGVRIKLESLEEMRKRGGISSKDLMELRRGDRGPRIRTGMREKGMVLLLWGYGSGKACQDDSASYTGRAAGPAAFRRKRVKEIKESSPRSSSTIPFSLIPVGV
jgi:hypothetical protein